VHDVTRNKRVASHIFNRLGLAAVAVSALCGSATLAADPVGMIQGEYCAGTGNNPQSARIITQIVVQSDKVYAHHFYGNRYQFPNAVGPQPGITEDPTLHPVTVDGNRLTYVSTRLSTITLSPVSSSSVTVTLEVLNGRYHDVYAATCHRPKQAAIH
jgi:hypothetical protein